MSSIHCSWADDSVPLCTDFSTGLNRVLEDHPYLLPVPDHIFSILNGGTYFAEIDFTEAYLQVKVSKAFRELLTVNTHRGLFQFTRLPFGVKRAPAIFQLIMDTMLTGVEGAAAYLDDIIVAGKLKQELIERINMVVTHIWKVSLLLTNHKILGIHF